MILVLLAGCGTDQEKPRLPHPQEESRCLSCDFDIPESPPISISEGSKYANQNELMFFCTVGSECDSIESVLIYNFTTEPSVVTQPVIVEDPDYEGVCDHTRFSLVKQSEYPFTLEPGHSLEIYVAFNWTTNVTSGILQVQVDGDTLNVGLIGKLFNP